MKKTTEGHFNPVERKEHKESFAWAYTQYDDMTSRNSKKKPVVVFTWLSVG